MAQTRYPRRKATIRMPGYDYRQPGTYFVTICTRHRRRLFGEVVHNTMYVNDVGAMVTEAWCELPATFPGIALDAVVIMPDHVHGVILLGTESGIMAVSSLANVVRSFKGRSTRRYLGGIEEHGWPPLERRLWQQRYHDRIVRTDAELAKVRTYIETNPERWWNRQTELSRDEDHMAPSEWRTES